MKPSFLGLIFTGFLNLAAVLLFFIYYSSMTPVSTIQCLLLFAISIGTHSVLHFQQEIAYNFNPLENKWIPT